MKVGNSEWGFLKLTPLSRIAAIVGAVSSDTISARRPSGMKSTTLCGGFAAEAGKMVQTPNIQHSAMICSFLTGFNSLSDCSAFEPLLNGRVRQKYYGVGERVKPGAPRLNASAMGRPTAKAAAGFRATPIAANALPASETS